MNKIGNLSPYFKRPYNGLFGGGGGIIPLAGIIDLSATESGGNVSLTWTDPDDIVKGGKTITAWTSTKIVRKEGSAPIDSTDGDLILTETTKNQYSSSGYIDSTISASGTYYYVAFAVADNGLETISNIESVSVVVSQYKTLTITREEKADMSSGRVYSDDATGMTAGSTDFDEFFGYSAVLLAPDGSEVEEVKQSSSGTLDMNSFQGALTGTANNVMIKFPRRGIKMSKTGNFVSLSITDDPNKEGFQYYAFTKGTTAKDNLYLGAYKGTFSDDNINVSSAYSSSTHIKSRATKVKTLNFSPCGYQPITTMREAALRYNNGYSMITIYPRRYINCLYMMKYGNPNSQSVVGAGYTGGSESVAPGGTNTQTSATYGTSSATQQVKLFGLEDWWGNMNEFMDGCFMDASKNLTVDKTNSIFQSSAYATNLGTGATGYLRSIDGSNDGMFRNTSSSPGSATTYYTDNEVSSASRVLRGGGHWSDGTNAGVFRINMTDSASLISNNSTRLQYL